MTFIKRTLGAVAATAASTVLIIGIAGSANATTPFTMDCGPSKDIISSNSIILGTMQICINNLNGKQSETVFVSNRTNRDVNLFNFSAQFDAVTTTGGFVLLDQRSPAPFEDHTIAAGGMFMYTSEKFSTNYTEFRGKAGMSLSSQYYNTQGHADDYHYAGSL
ncbi:hypothetical protein [Streptomyces sp. NPDC058701]|uniref:hypothetical protein n=1 Tax=Streptomyces sp. NPDC058701 TaxID=3346608 RepID=UPI0036603C8C